MQVVYESKNAMALLAIQNELCRVRSDLQKFANDGGHWCAWLPDNIKNQEAFLRSEEIRLRNEYSRLYAEDAQVPRG